MPHGLSNAHRLLVLGGLGASSFAQQIAALNPSLWLRLSETSGTIADNAAYTDAPGAELLTDTGLEAWATSSNLTNYVEGVAAGSTLNQETTIVHGGSNAARMDIGAGNELAQFRQGVVTVGDTYRVSAYARSDSGTPTINLLLSTAVQIFTISDSWAQYSGDIIADATTGPIFQRRSAAGLSIYWDDLSCKLVGQLDGFVNGATVGQTGLLGANHAYSFDGSNDLITARNTSIDGLTEFTLWLLINPSSAGEGDAGTFMIKADEFEFRFNSSSRDLYATVHYSTTDAEATTTTALSTSAWQTVGLRIDNTSKQIDIFIDGVEAEYDSRVTGEGTRVSNTNPLIVGNNAGGTQSFAGLIDEAVLTPSAATDNQFLTLHQSSGA